MARRLGDLATIASTLSARFLTLWGPENSTQRLQIASDVVALGEEARDRELVLRGHVWRIVSLMELGDWVGADIELAIHARLADELRDPLHLWYVPLYQANRAMLEGRMGGCRAPRGRGVRDRPRRAVAERRAAVCRAALRAADDAGPPERGRAVARGVRPPLSGRAGVAGRRRVRERGRRAHRARAARVRVAERGRPGRGPARRRVAVDGRVARPHGRACWATRAGPASSASCSCRTPIARSSTGRGATCLGPVSRFVAIAAATDGRWDDVVALPRGVARDRAPVGRRSARRRDPGRARRRARAGRGRRRAGSGAARGRAGPRAADGAARAARTLGDARRSPPRRRLPRRPPPRRGRPSSRRPQLRGSRSTAAATSGRSARRARRSSCATRRA